ncbi:hypothetical protein CEV34_4761 [Brucella pseudogrignonensis]|uniref:Uncharacterized protein n=1 Tax=Brucella pseudogrignonensis TaxID=419475 RepID=A0A256G4U3_9HYPH|nr:hypothetical protein CEV34_4761 [Brucella pseudogrignonensis]
MFRNIGWCPHISKCRASQEKLEPDDVLEKKPKAEKHLSA